MTSPERLDPPQAADERATLMGFLDYHRATLRLKVDGLTREQLAVRLAPSTMTLGGLVKHLALVEHWWSNGMFLGQEDAEPWASADWDADKDWEWHSAVDDTPEQLLELFTETAAETDRVFAGVELDSLSVRPGRQLGTPFSARWILVHLVEEYARHNGHADLLRESIDGVTGE